MASIKRNLEEFCKQNNIEYLLEEWDFEKNRDTNPLDVGAYSKKKVWWICKECNNSWQASISSRSVGHGCPMCGIKKRSSKSRVKYGINDFETWCNNNDRLDLLTEWNSKENGKSPSEVAYGSKKVYIWRCSVCNNRYESNIPNRRFGNNCPYCSNQKVKRGMNDFETYCKDNDCTFLLKEWDYSANSIKPYEITKGAKRKVWWVCNNCGNSYDSTISHRISGRGCPYCKDDGRKRALAGYNDFETYCKDNDCTYLLEEWDYKKNELLPSEVTYGSTKMIWWQCPRCGNEYQMLTSRRRRGDGCPSCGSFIRTSFREQSLFYYLSKVFNDVVNRYIENDLELDIYISKLKTGIEYDGQAWHKDIERDIRKREKCENRGIRLINIREPQCPPMKYLNNGDIIELSTMKDSEYREIIWRVIKMLSTDGSDIDIDFERDKYEIYNLYLNTTYNNSVEYLYPDIAREWDYDKNEGVKPSQVSAASRTRIRSASSF